MSFAERWDQLRETVDRTLSVCGRSFAEVRIVAVSKTVSAGILRGAHQAGCRDFGESRVQEFLEKKPLLPGDIRWHFVGHLQTNKARRVAGEAALIHSLDSRNLAEALNRIGEQRGLRLPVLLQINTSGEPTKGGFGPKGLEEDLDKMQKLPCLEFQGLMTIGPLTEDKEIVRASFRRLRELKDGISGRFPKEGFKELSMGMSHDYEIALEEGATILRIGTLLFGERV
jgi:pyridoxal phosphate enzyme (YggS family)